MTTSTLHFISQVKLGELRRQRSLLLEAYDRLSAEAAARGPLDGLRTLCEGLHNVRVAGKPLHADLGHIELLLKAPAPSLEIVDFWRRRLEAELATGRLRADIVYLFGALLGEWGGADSARLAFLEERQQAHADLLRQATTPAEEGRPHELPLLDEILAGLGPRREQAPAQLADAVRRALDGGNNAATNLERIADNIYLPGAVRQEARRFLKDAVLQTQYEDAMRVATRDLRSWSWPTAGVATRALWTRNKWRLYANLSLVQLSIINSFGRFWSHAVERVYGNALQLLNRLARYQKLEELSAPEVIIDNERRMLAQERQRIDLGWYERVDPWDGTPVVPTAGPVPAIVTRRVSEQAALRQGGGEGYYGGYGASQMVRLVQAEVRTLRAAFPDRPLFVGKLDIRDYFASLPHALLMRMLRGLGLPEEGLAAVERFLAVPYLVDGRVASARRGVPMDQHLSHWLAEWLLRLMERFVHERAQVRIIRQVDDICLLAPDAASFVAAWRGVQRFLEACGLASNEAKCGACALGAELPAGLAQAWPRWGLLELTPAGDWRVHEPSLAAFCADTRNHVDARHSVLAKVMLYNAHLRFLTSAAGLALDLGEVHRQSVNEALRRFEAEFFGSGEGIVAGLRRCIAERYLEETQLSHLPESWLCWPVTAGGLSLRSAFVLAGQYQQAFAERQPQRVAAPARRPTDWQSDQAWAAFYNDQLKNLEPAKPRESKLMKSLVDDFIARGQEISAGQQQTLSDYWRAVLGIYGPEILDKFGTFRFLLTDLVPLQLIHERLLHEGSLDAPGDTAS